MGLFSNLFGKNKNNELTVPIGDTCQVVTGYKGVSYTREGGLYEQALIRSAIHAIANQCSKLNPELVGVGAQKYKYLLKYAPNQYQTTSQFLYRLVTALKVNTTAFIVPVFDDTGDHIVGLYTPIPSAVRLVEHNGVMWVVFDEGTKRTTCPLDRVGILTTHQYKDPLFGSGNGALSDDADLWVAQLKGSKSKIIDSADIRFILKLQGIRRPEDEIETRDKFVRDNLTAKNKGGAIVVSQNVAEIIPVDSKAYVLDDKQVEKIKENVFEYFGVSEAILKNEYTEDVWNAFYEGCIEPIALQIGQVLTRILLTRTEIGYGNEIMFSSNRLQYASNSTKLQFVQSMVDRGLISANDALAVFNLPPIEGGDRRVIRGEYIDADTAAATVSGGGDEDEQTASGA